MSSTLYFDTYDGGLGREQMLCVGDGEHRLLIIPPLFDELNRMRRTIVMAMREAQEINGIASFLPDLPGQKESQAPLSQCRRSDWHAAILTAAQASDATHVASVRSACVLDDALSHLPRWRNSAIAGERVVTQLVRTQLASDKANGLRTTRADYDGNGESEILNVAGYSISAAMVKDLSAATLSPFDKATDRAVAQSLGPALWLRAEPVESVAFARNLAAHWAEWMRQ